MAPKMPKEVRAFFSEDGGPDSVGLVSLIAIDVIHFECAMLEDNQNCNNYQPKITCPDV
ncbi:hypothetical protein HMPREF0880_02404 [Yokenella regensburgei ATCC 43003]|nr:hypothetical protein HMPREF0880_02404 [Yokenella regensburgei ATCC 43003]